jgi:hypothetical protein
MAKKLRKESGSLNARPIVDFIDDFVKLFFGKGIEGYFFGKVLP